MRPPRIDFARVKAYADVAQVFAHCDVEIRGRGMQRTAWCPFHEDHRPSLSVNADTKVYYCHGCGHTGDILAFVAALKGCSLPDAATLIAAWCDFDLPVLNGEAATRSTNCHEGRRYQQGQRGRTKIVGSPDCPAADGEVNAPLAFALKLDPRHPYLKERGVTSKAIQDFGLGYCSRGLMHGRVCVPIHSADGSQLLGYAGRWASNDIPEGTAKWLLPPKLQKSRLLFNLHRLSKTNHVVLVESFWSGIRLHTMQVPVLGLMGRTISEDQIALLLTTGISNLTLMLDGDDPGRCAVQSMLPRLAARFFVHVAELPDEAKPHSVDKEMLKTLLALP